ncbi:phosphatase PAP2 family protein [Patescibacteria group bacterium]|nr:phosphatase PAP2 family protein [Patescibacteria group bacterium]
MQYLVKLHIAVFNWLFHLTTYSSELNVWVYIIAELFDWYVVFAGVIFIMVHTHRQRINRPVFIDRRSLTEGIYTVVGVLVAWFLSYGMKMLFSIARPFIQLSDVIPLFLYGSYDSFPSGHATLFSALAVAIYLHHRFIGSIFILLAFLIGTARVVAGVHFPIDVLTGWVIGTVVSLLTYYLFTRKYRQ